MKDSKLKTDQDQRFCNLSLTELCESLKSKYRSNNRVLFVQIPQFIFKSFDPKVAKKKGYYAFPPTGLQHLSDALKERDVDLRILDLNLTVLKKASEDETFDLKEWITVFKDYLEDFDPFIVGVSCMYDSGIQSLIQILEFLKERDKTVVVTGGVIGTYEWKNLLSRDLCHFVVKGEGENKINYLFDNLLDENRKFKRTPGICYKSNDEYLETGGVAEEVVVDTDLTDTYSLVDIEDYYKYGSLNPFSRMAGIDDSPFAAIQLSRGCRGVCTFCSVRDFMGKGVRKRPIEKVLREMEYLIDEHGVRHFEWLDDDLLFFKEEFKILMKTVIKQKWDITWSANNGLIATSIDDELMALMRDSGCIGFKIGIETGNEAMLKKVKKPASLDAFRKTARIINEYPEIFVGGNFMLGFPEERFSQMMDSFRFFMELNLDWGAFTVCQAIRGATAFMDFEDYFDEQISSRGETAKNFVPAREASHGLTTETTLYKCLDVFNIPLNSIPSEEQVKEIWFTFNLVGNFISNKNLRPGGRVEKFISWVEMAQEAYPTNPYMCLFLSLAYVIKGDEVRAMDYHERVVSSSKSDYWQERFSAFGLDNIINNFPKSKTEAINAVERLRNDNTASGKIISRRLNAGLED